MTNDYRLAHLGLARRRCETGAKVIAWMRRRGRIKQHVTDCRDLTSRLACDTQIA
jgi:hypothetical protein